MVLLLQDEGEEEVDEKELQRREEERVCAGVFYNEPQ